MNNIFDKSLKPVQQISLYYMTPYENIKLLTTILLKLLRSIKN